LNYALLLSGGTGNRINSDIPKQYIKAGGMMMVSRTFAALSDCSYIDAVLIVADKKWRDGILGEIESLKLDKAKLIGFSDPGRNRQESVYNGMTEILRERGTSGRDTYGIDPSGMDSEDTILIHDAARPFITTALLDACYRALPGHDGVMPVLRMKDTVYISHNGKRAEELLDRDALFAGQAPELFYFKTYFEANKKLLPDDILFINGASEPMVRLNKDIALIPGDEGNFKVTTDADLKKYMEWFISL